MKAKLRLDGKLQKVNDKSNTKYFYNAMFDTFCVMTTI